MYAPNNRPLKDEAKPDRNKIEMFKHLSKNWKNKEKYKDRSILLRPQN